MFNKVNDCLYERRIRSIFNIILNILIGAIIIALVAEVLFGLKYSGIYVVQSSMYPTFTGAVDENSPGGDYVYVDRYAVPDYGKIVIVEKNDGTSIIKRAVAFGGDYVKLDRGKLYVKYAGEEQFTPIEESYVAPENNTPSLIKNTFPLSGGKVDENGFYVEEGYIFLLGDNRDVSVDSREGGGTPYPVSQLFGVVTDWSIKYKSFFTAMHGYFSFDLPRYLGFVN